MRHEPMMGGTTFEQDYAETGACISGFKLNGSKYKPTYVEAFGKDGKVIGKFASKTYRKAEAMEGDPQTWNQFGPNYCLK